MRKLFLIFCLLLLPHKQSEEQSELHVYSLCGLQEQTSQGEHRRVVTEGVYLAGLAGTYLVSPECSSRSTRVEFELKTQRNGERLGNLIRAKLQPGVRGDGTPVLVVFDGEFHGPPLPDPKLPAWLRNIYHPGWDRNAMTKLEVFSIISVMPLPEDHPCNPSEHNKAPCFQRDAVSKPAKPKLGGPDYDEPSP